LDAVYPTVAPNLPAVANGVAPSFSKFLRMTKLDRPDPDLKVRYLLAIEVPGVVSEDDPAFG